MTTSADVIARLETVSIRNGADGMSKSAPLELGQLARIRSPSRADRN